ncbi:bifunctional methyltransferase/pyrophosphohydrolase YabN [Neobacillus thermocopriae]|uniref:Nucleoside triphosphate pyrophosphohydrolase n=1 Tax=Neobacillus thermocopriae TaxID=1215031 RepID=A0A6B3TUJ1_9BACI|nr:nucleoside triphosphate pyrophosphohydrolase [Neobacillus thermocopriae]MED3624592.1 nucleoside triphosphate pyrophosphohydrolase [Neobacillus thermocopriae]MED3714566.1 nucleoside triphosphate pyrophosphohydrolase [Neobacillus thermocopriae]NEX79969.1 nucleoside triphosphate pyrophosphohydrolase [Neobacillus thermocopriae]
MGKKIELIGLGPGDINQLQFGLFKKLTQANHVYLRTKEHPVVQDLVREGMRFTSFDSVYEKHEQFEDVYQEIVQILLDKAKTEVVIYAVPGHPLVAERTVQLLLEKGEEEDIEISVIGGQSFIDALFASLKIDPIEGFQLIDGTSFRSSELQVTQHIIISQVYDQLVASDVKISLMERYPDDYEVYIVTSAGNQDECIEKVPLYELDRNLSINNLRSIYIPPIKEDRLLWREFSRLRDIIAQLRGPNGCPWDKEQTHESLKKYLIEETYEVIDAITSGDIDHLIEELGDVLLQVLLHAQIGEDDGYFSIEDVIEGLSAKMIRRHPHVFGEIKVEDAKEVVENWQEIKRKEKGEVQTSFLEGVSKELPNLLRAYELQKKAAKVGFDWEEIMPALEKVKEELEEFIKELDQTEGSLTRAKKEFGDLLFAFVNVARFLKINPEEALFETNEKFIRRFQYIEKQVEKSGKEFEEHTLEELDKYWDEAKLKGL